ncbi:hypothetical protein [Lysinibacillus fusiformis]|uniref:hypothetical protein n=1 Tax=Lysinibacillus fusiformis TaxID=28031 RepID=UPI0004693A01|nr:hypothetical protein [Lysinibacillus fusiformis]
MKDNKKAIKDYLEKAIGITGAFIDGLSLDFLNLFRTISSDIKTKNLETNLQTLKCKVHGTILNGELPSLSEDDNNLMLSLLEEMQSIYTEVKRECITNLVTNMLCEKKRGTFQIYTYQVIFDQFKQMYDPEILLLKEIYEKHDELLKKEIVGNEDVLSLDAISQLKEYDLYRLKKLENLVFVNETFNRGSEKDSGEFYYNEKYFETFYNKVCTLIYPV